MNTITIEGTQVKIGDYVSFKCDIEQTGKLVKITRGSFGSGYDLVLEDEDGFEGGYIGGQTQTVMRAEDCWVD